MPGHCRATLQRRRHARLGDLDLAHRQHRVHRTPGALVVRIVEQLVQRRGTICHDSPKRSLSQPHAPARHVGRRSPHSRSTSAWSSQSMTKDTDSLNVNSGPPLSPGTVDAEGEADCPGHARQPGRRSAGGARPWGDGCPAGASRKTGRLLGVAVEREAGMGRHGRRHRSLLCMREVGAGRPISLHLGRRAEPELIGDRSSARLEPSRPASRRIHALPRQAVARAEGLPYGKGGSKSLFDAEAPGVKLHGYWLAFPQHTTFLVVEADDIAGLQAFLKPASASRPSR